MSTVTDRQLLLAVVGGGLIFGIVLGLVATPTGTDGPDQSPNVSIPTSDTPVTFAAGTGVSRLFLWGFQEQQVPMPEDVRLRSTNSETAAELLERKQAAVGFVHLNFLESVLRQNPDARVLPYQLRSISEPSVYALAESDIEEVRDLVGRDVAAPIVVAQTTELLTMLDREYNVSTQDINLVNRGMAALQNSSWDGAEAAILVEGTPRDRTRLIFDYERTLEDRFGRVGFPAVFVISDPAYRDAGESVVDAVNESLRVAKDNQDSALSYQASAIGLPRSALPDSRQALNADRPLLVRMEGGYRDSLQYRMGLYATNDSAPDISSRIVDAAP